ncbi:MAG: hypothetical protein JNK72_14010 [Myxococcales bacterium]|nr:hypothetical protein [Myxococcales bacterium]
MSVRLVWEPDAPTAASRAPWREEARLAAGDASTENRLYFGDNLSALGALEADPGQRFRLVYLDPPYNTGAAFDHYDDHRAPEDWLSMMMAVLRAVKPLLRDDGVLVLQTDRHESAYAKVLCDMVFGRAAYQTTLAVRMSATSGYKIGHSVSSVVKNTEYLHVYAPGRFVLCARAFELAPYDDHYNLFVEGLGSLGARVVPLLEVDDVRATFEAEGLPRQSRNLAKLYETKAFRRWVAAHAGQVVRAHTAPLPAQAEHRAGQLFATDDPADRVLERRYRGQGYLLRRRGRQLEQLIPIGLKLNPIDDDRFEGAPVMTNVLGDWWDGFHLDMGNVSKEGETPFKNGKKPERLLYRLMRMFTDEGDAVLDPFGGSGTTAAVALKARRRFVLIEQGAQLETHIVPRLARVVAGDDRSGVSTLVAGPPGDGFRVFVQGLARGENCATEPAVSGPSR